ncbi:potassium channel family protein [Algoriphagus sp. NG3]|uniref:potassium channel family protein n=1 Tax=Algoriphagus sp. NG3 TaxID=3097546 RepID=UPI002A83BBA4|nr:potassium channel family protein [Algoriphagus sp. NG3]WPR76948.1 potassium channel family protein [Algoriphagus sp. NG3]
MDDLKREREQHVKTAVYSFKNFWMTDSSFSVLFVILVFTVFVLPILIVYGHIGSVFISSVFLFLFFTGIFSSKEPVLIILTAILFTAQLSLRLVRYSDFDYDFYLWERLLGVVNMLVFIGLNVKQLFRNDRITAHRVIGAINVYLLMAILGAFVFEIIYIYTGSVIGGRVELMGVDEDFSSYIYFSMVSMTTVGFGEMYPAQIMAKMLSVLLAMIGILYPTVIIARLVSGSNILKNE